MDSHLITRQQKKGSNGLPGVSHERADRSDSIVHSGQRCRRNLLGYKGQHKPYGRKCSEHGVCRFAKRCVRNQRSICVFFDKLQQLMDGDLFRYEFKRIHRERNSRISAVFILESSCDIVRREADRAYAGICQRRVQHSAQRMRCRYKSSEALGYYLTQSIPERGCAA